jgi:hypothetical protein
MKKVQILTAGFMVAAIAVFVVAMAGGTYAANTTDSVTVNAKVNGTCSKTVAGIFSTLAIDPSNVADQLFSVGTDATVQCSKNLTTTSITATSANGTASDAVCTGSGSYLTGFTMKDAGTGKTVNYSFACAASVAGIGFGTAGDGTHDVSLGMAAKVLQADVQAADYDNGNTYTDQVTLTINF